jgi:hypothetical protein
MAQFFSQFHCVCFISCVTVLGFHSGIRFHQYLRGHTHTHTHGPTTAQHGPTGHTTFLRPRPCHSAISRWQLRNANAQCQQQKRKKKHNDDGPAAQTPPDPTRKKKFKTGRSQWLNSIFSKISFSFFFFQIIINKRKKNLVFFFSEEEVKKKKKEKDE